MNEHHEQKIVVKVERKNRGIREFTRVVPNDVDKQTFVGDLIDEYSYLMNEDQDRSIMFHDDVTGDILISKRYDIIAIEFKR